ncbi:UbiA family prenyltransferase [Limnoglobus roseus]|uniref:Protoheme IX farnesyltransferase n=1 Tax=Limnoglobus roseus TaxID=2598579 RepID=A0A5C1A7A1_9BACT|nr:UbiA family prenyltransferase [Limnoglobus roseus]QEL13846.1 Protoheme IX farnesyltransferase [Limnoglobus roseus]
MKGKLLAYAQLLRIPNVFTAFADIAMAACAAGYVADRPDVFAVLLLASGCLYCGGMVWNDFFDRGEDAKARPFRPIPSGRVPVRVALLLGLTLMAGGVALTLFVPTAFPIALAIVAAVVLYDAWLKHTPFGPVAMGTCRFLNILLGLSGAGGDVLALPSLHLAATTGLYIVGVTWFARTEEGQSNRRQLILAAVVMLAALGLAVTVPTHRLPGTTPIYFPYLVVAFGVLVGVKVVAAIQQPGPKEVQAAVKRSILGLVALDAVLATAFVGAWGLLILLLYLPARWLGRWVYST